MFARPQLFNLMIMRLADADPPISPLGLLAALAAVAVGAALAVYAG